MRSLLLGVLLIALCGVAHAQVTCQTYGNTTNCNGSVGPAISPIPFTDYAGMQARANLQNQQAALAQQQAQLARAQAEAIRQQTIAANQQRFLAAVAAASDEDLRAAAAHWNSVKCGWLAPASCHDDASFAVQAINVELQRRSNRDTEQQSEFRKKENALHDALANGVITKAEYDIKHSALPWSRPEQP